MAKIKKPKMMVHFEPKQAANVYEMYLYDDVTAKGKFDWASWRELESETSAKYFREQLAQIPATATINLYINSNGGDVKEGVGIYNQLKRHGAKVNGYVDGNAYSVAFLILMACDHKVMNLGTSALIHEMWMTVSGNAKALRSYADDLDKLMESNRQIFLEACNHKLTEEELIEMMEVETFLTPDECLKYGFIDEINGKTEEDPEEDLEDDSEEELLQELRGLGIMELQEQAKKRQEFLQEITMLKEETNKTKEYSGAADFFGKLI